MEQISDQWFWAAIIGFVVGAVLVWLMSRSSKHKVDADYSALRNEYDKYRQEVNAHFAKTADAVDTLTKSYKDVFTHLSDGAEQLMDKKALQAQLDKRQGKSVTLAYLVDAAGKAEDEPKSVAQETVVADQATTDKAGADNSNSTQAKTETAPAAKVAAQKSSAKPAESAKTKAAVAPTVAAQAEASDKQVEAKDVDKIGKNTQEGDASKVDKTKANEQVEAGSAEAGKSASKSSGVVENNVITAAESEVEEDAAAQTPAQKAAEKAGLSTAQQHQTMEATKEESAIESVKRHIRDNNQEKP